MWNCNNCSFIACEWHSCIFEFCVSYKYMLCLHTNISKIDTNRMTKYILIITFIISNAPYLSVQYWSDAKFITRPNIMQRTKLQRVHEIWYMSSGQLNFDIICLINCIHLIFGIVNCVVWIFDISTTSRQYTQFVQWKLVSFSNRNSNHYAT